MAIDDLNAIASSQEAIAHLLDLHSLNESRNYRTIVRCQDRIDFSRV
ncbi:MAG: hypothetical protein F6K10_34330 [Moorea sp. SIO2B7]|nr:hypothetical protein [Moorena sp. SIO2B7]